MYTIEQYLRRLGHTGPLAPDHATLRALHRAHLATIPYDNVSVVTTGHPAWRIVGIDVDTVFDEIVLGNRGGTCHELNGLFRVLLTDLGFDVSLLSASSRLAGGGFGPELEHSFNAVHLDDDVWLADVGFAGPSFLEPLKISDEVRVDNGCAYRLTPDGGFLVLERRAKAGEWQAVYRFRTRTRKPSDWDVLDDAMTSFFTDSVAAGTTLLSRAFDGGQVVLLGRRCLRVVDGHEQTSVIVDSDEFQRTVDHIRNA